MVGPSLRKSARLDPAKRRLQPVEKQKHHQTDYHSKYTAKLDKGFKIPLKKPAFTTDYLHKLLHRIKSVNYFFLNEKSNQRKSRLRHGGHLFKKCYEFAPLR